MANKSIMKNYVYNAAYQLLIIILPIITTPYLARTLGSDGIGTFGYTFSIVTYYILFGSLGISLYGQREIAYVQDNREKRSKIFFELTIFRICCMAISCFIFYFNCIKSNIFSMYYKLFIFEMIANCFDITWFYQGMENFKKTVIRNVIVKIISIISIFIFIKTSNDLSKYILIYSIGNLISHLVLWIDLKKYIKIPEKIQPFHHYKEIMVFFIPQIAIQIYTVLDKTMIGIIISKMSEVGYYEQSQKVIKLILSLVTALGTVMLPRIANCYADGNNNLIKKYMINTFKFVFMISIPMALGIIAVSDNFSPLFFGPGFEKVTLILSILSVVIILIGLSNVTGTQYLLPTKRQKENTISVISGACVNFCLNLILIKYFATYGAAVATVIAELCVTVIQLYYIRNEFNVFRIIKLSKNYVISGILMFTFCIAINTLINNYVYALIIQVCIGIISYFVVLYILKDDMIFMIIDKLKKILKRS